MAVNAVRLHSSVEVKDVVPGKCVAVVRGAAEIPTSHSVVLTLINTSVRKHAYRKSVDVVRIRIKERIVLPDSRSTHLPVGHRLIGIIKNMVFR